MLPTDDPLLSCAALHLLPLLEWKREDIALRLIDQGMDDLVLENSPHRTAALRAADRAFVKFLTNSRTVSAALKRAWETPPRPTVDESERREAILGFRKQLVAGTHLEDEAGTLADLRAWVARPDFAKYLQFAPLLPWHLNGGSFTERERALLAMIDRAQLKERILLATRVDERLLVLHGGWMGEDSVPDADAELRLARQRGKIKRRVSKWRHVEWDQGAGHSWRLLMCWPMFLWKFKGQRRADMLSRVMGNNWAIPLDTIGALVRRHGLRGEAGSGTWLR